MFIVEFIGELYGWAFMIILFLLVTSVFWLPLLAILEKIVETFCYHLAPDEEKKEIQEYKSIKNQFGWSDKYGDSYVSNEIGKILWVNNDRWELLNTSDVIAYSVEERKHNENSNNILGRAVVGDIIAGPVGAVVGAGTGIRSGDVIERLGVVFTLSNGRRYEILEFEGNEPASKMESIISRHNRLVRLFDEMVNGKIN